MKLTSNYAGGTLFWRTFSKQDTVYLIGLMEGYINDNDTMTYENPTGSFQLELKHNNIFGAQVVKPGHVYSNDDEYIVQGDGTLISVEDATIVDIDPHFAIEPIGNVTQFFSPGPADSVIQLLSTVSQTTNTNGSVQTTTSSSATDDHGTQVGGGVSASIPAPLKIGVNVNGSVSDRVQHKIESTVSNQLGQQIATTLSYSESQPITLKAGKLTSIVTSWQRRYVTGTVKFGNTTLSYEATIAFVASRLDTAFDSPDAMPPELQTAYAQQFPGWAPLGDGSVVRESSDDHVYVMFGNAKFWIPDPAELNSLYGGWGKVVVVSPGALAGTPTVPLDGTLLRENGSDSVWVIEAGKRRHITDASLLVNFGGWPAVHLVPSGATSGFPTGDPVQ